MSPGTSTYVAGMSEEELRKQRGITDIIKIGSNENPLGPSPLAVEAMQQAVANLHRYPPMSDDDFRSTLANRLGRGLTPDHLVTGNGACDVLSMIATNYLTVETECLICRPTFPIYDFTAQRMGATAKYIDLDPESFAYNTGAILSAVTDRTRLLYVCSPNNPTGGIMTGGQMKELIRGLPPNALLVADEVYHHFATTEDYPDTIAHVMGGENVIITHSFSKAYGLAGGRLGYGIARPDIIERVSRSRLPFHLNNVTLEGGAAALKDAVHLERSIATIVAGREWLQNELDRIGIRNWPSQGNFILFKTDFAAADVSEQLLQRGVIIRPMTNFYLPDHLRVTVGRPVENERFINSLTEAISVLS